MRSYYNVGLQAEVRVIGPRHYAVGATNLTVSDYQKRARDIFAALDKPFVLVALGQGFGMTHSQVFVDHDALAGAYDKASSDPQHVEGLTGPAAYVAMFDANRAKDPATPDTLVDEGFFVAEDVIETPPKSNLGLWFAVGATAIGGVMAFGGKKKGP